MKKVDQRERDRLIEEICKMVRRLDDKHLVVIHRIIRNLLD